MPVIALPPSLLLQHYVQTVTPSNSTYGLYFSGHFVFEAILDALDATGKLQDATEIILSGQSPGQADGGVPWMLRLQRQAPLLPQSHHHRQCAGASAGGIGIWPNVDYLQERYPKARVVAAPIAGASASIRCHQR